MTMADSPNDSVKPWPGHKLFDPANYTGEEYFVLFLLAFIVFVIIKHLIFHTGFYWWYGNARFYIPNKFWSLVTGRSLSARLLAYLKATLPEKNRSASEVADKISFYCKEKEFALNTGDDKGKVLVDIVTSCQPQTVVIYRPHCGYVLMKLLTVLPPTSQVYLIEPNNEFVTFNKELAEFIGASDRVTILKSDLADGLSELKKNYSKKVDFVFFNRTCSEQSTLKDAVLKLEDAQMLSAKSDGNVGSVIVVDKVVHFTDPEFLKYVRNSKSYENKYYQFILENSPHDIIDAMEQAVYLGK